MVSESLKNALRITTGFVEIFFICGLVYGWGAFDYILKEESVYQELCKEENDNGNVTINCEAQDTIYLQITSVGTVILSAGALAVGSLLDRYGLRTARIYGGVLLTLAFVFYYCLSYSSHLLWLFWIFLCMGTLAPLLTLLPLANTFPERKGLIITVINGVYDCSVAATAFWAGFYENGMSVSTMALVLLLVMGFYWIRTFALLPKTASSVSDKNNVEDVDLEKEKLALSAVEIQDISGPTIWETLQSASFMLYYYCYLILDSRIVLTFYLLPTMLDSVYEDEEDKMRISQLFTKANTLSFIICPLAGIIADTFHRKTASHMMMIFVIAIQTVISILPLFKADWAMYIFCILFPIGRTMFYGVSSMIMLDQFPQSQFGVLYGFANLSAGVAIFALTNFVAVFSQSLTQFMVALAIFSASCLAHPLYELLRKKKVDH